MSLMNDYDQLGPIAPATTEVAPAAAPAAPALPPGSYYDDSLYNLLAVPDGILRDVLGQTNPNTAATGTAAGETGKKDMWSRVTDVFKDVFKSDSVKAAGVTVAGAALAGAASGYFTGQKLAQDKELAQQQININQQRATEEAAMNKARLANQSGKFKFAPVGLINQPAKTTAIA